MIRCLVQFPLQISTNAPSCLPRMHRLSCHQDDRSNEPCVPQPPWYLSTQYLAMSPFSSRPWRTCVHVLPQADRSWPGSTRAPPSNHHHSPSVSQSFLLTRRESHRTKISTPTTPQNGLRAIITSSSCTHLSNCSCVVGLQLVIYFSL